ncbi:MAG TPA: DUF3084 domain-containing protein [Chthonomonadaceae bacterium]|nr:DUF3084 domain-containing protein [Chthonomonadaceae bacterium]
MIWTLLALLSLITLGGFISYYGDLQGRRWGKKRVSWFGLRPKHTAILITSLTGAFVALLSVATLLMISPAVRDIVLRGETAIRENKQLNARLIRQALYNNGIVTEKQNQLALANEQLSATRADLANNQTRLKLVDAKLKTVQDNYIRVCQDQTRTKQDEARARQEVARLSALKAQLERSIAQDKVQFRKEEQLNARAAYLNKDLADQNIEYARQSAGLEKSNTKLQTENEQLASRNADLHQEHDQLMAQNTAQKSALEAQYKAYQDLDAKVSELTAKRDDLYRQLANTGQSYMELRHAKMTLPAGAELARCTIDAHLRPEAVRRDLKNLLDEASTTALRYQAAPGDNGRAVMIVPKRVVTPTGEEDAGEDASLKALTEDLAGSDTPVVVHANSVTNAVEGEQVLVELIPQVLHHEIIFDKGAVIATRRLDARQPLARVVDDILQFLQQDVKNAAIRSGMIPRVDPDTGKEEVGIIGPRELVTLTEQVLRKGGLIEISAVAKAPISAADSLRLSTEQTDRENMEVRITHAHGGR